MKGALRERGVRERPVIFSGPMVRAILDGKKTQTRRVVKPGLVLGAHEAARNFVGAWPQDAFDYIRDVLPARCSYGQPGDRLWVRETWAGIQGRPLYRATSDHLTALPATIPGWDRRWRSPIFMPRWASRITLEITDVRVERVQEISDSDAVAEGVAGQPCPHGFDYCTECGEGPRVYFRTLWDSINAKRGHPFDANPWVWVLTFRATPPTAKPETKITRKAGRP